MAKTLGQAIDKMLRKFDIEKPVRQGEALFIWDEVVGKTISNHTTPEKVSFGKLYIKVDSPVWRSELLFRKDEILGKINKNLNNANIKEIVLR
ncbi:MAG: DUF721 domain-containing protein [Candidatus Neomarinimicrobiota bacterium]|nr:MAG: DUF721 domain-containing protein [Candidatus Neomarinimicrobiota bacterium]